MLSFYPNSTVICSVNTSCQNINHKNDLLRRSLKLDVGGHLLRQHALHLHHHQHPLRSFPHPSISRPQRTNEDWSRSAILFSTHHHQYLSCLRVGSSTALCSHHLFFLVILTAGSDGRAPESWELRSCIKGIVSLSPDPMPFKTRFWKKTSSLL